MDSKHLTGFAPYTPVTVSSKTKPDFMRLGDSPDVLAAKSAEHRASLVERVTFPYQAPDRDGGSVGSPIEGSILEMEESVGIYWHLPVAHEVPAKVGKRKDGFNPYGSGPEPIGRRE